MKKWLYLLAVITAAPCSALPPYDLGGACGGRFDVACAGASSAADPVELDFDSGAQSDSGAVVTFSHTVSGSDTYLLVGAWTLAGSLFTLDSITYNGDALVLVSSTTDGPYLYGLANPDAGTHNVVITFSGSAGLSTGQSISFTGVDQTEPVGWTFSQTGSGTSVSKDATSTANAMVADLIFGGNGVGQDAAAGGGQTEYGEPYLAMKGSYELATGASTTMSWTLNDSVTWAHLGATLCPVGGCP